MQVHAPWTSVVALSRRGMVAHGSVLRILEHVRSHISFSTVCLLLIRSPTNHKPPTLSLVFRLPALRFAFGYAASDFCQSP